MTNLRFTAEVETYTVLILGLDEYQPTRRDLPPEFAFLDAGKSKTLRNQERIVLRTVFDDWDIPYSGKLRGWRDDSPLFVMHDDQLAGGLYLCDQNEFDEDPKHGQLHYVFVAPHFQGRGLYSVLFREAVKRAANWGLTHMYLNSDRYLLPEVYLRWGAKPYKQINKSSRALRVGSLQAPPWIARPLRRMSRQFRRALQYWHHAGD